MAAVFRRRRIKLTKTLGQTLKACRTRKRFSYEEVESATKIRTRYLQAMENDNYRDLPGPVYLVGYLTRYAQFLGLPPKKIVAQYKSESGMTARLPEPRRFQPADELRELRFTITPKTLLIVLIVLVFLTLGGYIGWQVRKFSAPPQVEILAPTEDVVTTDELTVQGKTNTTAQVTINGQAVSVNEQGEFSQKVSLTRGVNTIEIRAENRSGRQSSQVLKIFADFVLQANPSS